MSLLGTRFSSGPHSQRGAVIPLAAVGMVLAMIVASLAVDLGSLSHEARQNQKVADLAALDGVRALPSDPTSAVLDSATRNGFECVDLNPADGCGLTVQWSDSITGVFTSLPVTLPLANAVRVIARSPHSNDFPFTPGSNNVNRQATATLGNGSGCTLPNLCVVNTNTPIGTVRVGSTLATVDSAQSAIFNRLLNNVLGGGSFTLNAVGWEGISNGSVQFSKLKAALGYEAGTVESFANATFTFRQLLDASVSAMNQSGESAANVNAANRLATIASEVGASAGTVIKVGELFEVIGNVGSGMDVADARINALDIVRGGLALADSDHFAEMTLTAADLPAPVADLVDVKVKFGLIEAPQMKSGPAKDGTTYRTVATTSQVRLLAEVKLNLDLGLPARVNVVVPYLIDAGTAQARLDTINCATGNPVPTSVLIQGVTQGASANIGTTTNGALGGSGTPTPGVATLTDVSVTSLITVKINTTSVVTTSVSGKTEMKTFTPPYSWDNPPQNMTGTQLVSLPVLGGSNTNTEVRVAGLLDVGLSLSVEAALINALVGRSTAILNNVITPTMRAMGLSLAGAALWAPPPQNCSPSSYNVDPGGNTIVSIPSLSK